MQLTYMRTKPPISIGGFMQREEDGRVSKTGGGHDRYLGEGVCRHCANTGRDVRMSAHTVYTDMIIQYCIIYVN